MKKKIYSQPTIELAILLPSTIILAGSSGTGLPVGDPVPDQGGD